MVGLVVRHGNNGWSCSDMGEENLGKLVTYPGGLAFLES